ncbi:MAG: host attachment protein [Hyphomicrobiales bacterium]|nr:host attachment protein [Hyphomicrobiales bacterium]
MVKITVKAGEWVVVCDGGKALILENQGDAKFPNLRTRKTYGHENPKTSALGTDRPGRVHASATTGRSAVKQTDWHDQAEQDFLKMLAEKLDADLATGDVASIIIVAAPRELGMIRPHYTDALKTAIRDEIHKDMVNMPVYEIEKQITGVS